MLYFTFLLQYQIFEELDIPTVRNPRLPQAVIDNAASELITADVSMENGPNAIQSMLRTNYIMIPRDRTRELVQSIAPDGAEIRAPGNKRPELVWVALVSVGPFHEISADGHEKLNAQALRMGDISLPIYAYRDKWSGYLLKIKLLPNSRTAAAIGHLFLDLVAEYNATPIRVTTDKGSEIGWQSLIQESLRTMCAPDIYLDEYPATMALKSVHNTVIESLWRWFEQTTGHNLKAWIVKGMEGHIFHPHRPHHSEIFYWTFVPLIQDQLETFRTYWNYHPVRKQSEKINPSGHIPAAAFKDPQHENPNSRMCKIDVPLDVQESARAVLEEEVGPREEHLDCWYSPEFSKLADTTYKEVGSPSITVATAWTVFQSMAARIDQNLYN
ncbi:hypothetical protein FA13DRAFT_1754861 [Coprinellus micaceus]|uniref:Integrase core domain-containing protein n=1 Tax=Coprinellus micaceus TaxID=71717 RepID=A0A4Y7TBQ3_COPMI|nr:hypothetical protein FA13DRAFT_1754861 [Coprinellus micaceus]